MQTTRARYLEPPARPTERDLSVFLAGGIIGTEDWQARAFGLLADLDITVINPRRAGGFVLDDAASHGAQVEWEHRYLHEEPYRARLVLFWFPPSPERWVMQPIAMYELGRLIERGTPVVVGADPGYLRHRDVVKQLSLSRPDLRVHSTLEATVAAARQVIRDLHEAA